MSHSIDRKIELYLNLKQTLLETYGVDKHLLFNVDFSISMRQLIELSKFNAILLNYPGDKLKKIDPEIERLNSTFKFDDDRVCSMDRCIYVFKRSVNPNGCNKIYKIGMLNLSHSENSEYYLTNLDQIIIDRDGTEFNNLASLINANKEIFIDVSNRNNSNFEKIVIIETNDFEKGLSVSDIKHLNSVIVLPQSNDMLDLQYSTFLKDFICLAANHSLYKYDCYKKLVLDDLKTDECLYKKYLKEHSNALQNLFTFSQTFAYFDDEPCTSTCRKSPVYNDSNSQNDSIHSSDSSGFTFRKGKLSFCEVSDFDSPKRTLSTAGQVFKCYKLDLKENFDYIQDFVHFSFKSKQIFIHHYDNSINRYLTLIKDNFQAFEYNFEIDELFDIGNGMTNSSKGHQDKDLVHSRIHQLIIDHHTSIDSITSKFSKAFSDTILQEIDKISEYNKSIFIFTEKKINVMVNKFKILLEDQVKFIVNNFENEINEANVLLLCQMKTEMLRYGVNPEKVSLFMANLLSDSEIFSESNFSSHMKGFSKIWISGMVAMTINGFAVRVLLTDTVTSIVGGPIGIAIGIGSSIISIAGVSISHHYTSKKKYLKVFDECLDCVFKLKTEVVEKMFAYSTIVKEKASQRAKCTDLVL